MISCLDVSLLYWLSWCLCWWGLFPHVLYWVHHWHHRNWWIDNADLNGSLLSMHLGFSSLGFPLVRAPHLSTRLHWVSASSQETHLDCSLRSIPSCFACADSGCYSNWWCSWLSFAFLTFYLVYQSFCLFFLVELRRQLLQHLLLSSCHRFVSELFGCLVGSRLEWLEWHCPFGLLAAHRGFNGCLRQKSLCELWYGHYRFGLLGCFHMVEHCLAFQSCWTSSHLLKSKVGRIWLHGCCSGFWNVLRSIEFCGVGHFASCFLERPATLVMETGEILLPSDQRLVEQKPYWEAMVAFSLSSSASPIPSCLDRKYVNAQNSTSSFSLFSNDSPPCSNYHFSDQMSWTGHLEHSLLSLLPPHFDLSVR